MYAIDSTGKLQIIEKQSDFLKAIPMKQRLNTIWNFTKKLFPIFVSNGIDIRQEDQQNIFEYYIQPFDTHEFLTIFIKAPVSSTSDEVKISDLIKDEKNRQVFSEQKIIKGLKTDMKENLLFSIVRDENQTKPTWVLIYALTIQLERNRYDSKIINISPSGLIPYYDFVRGLKNKVISFKNNETIDTIDKKENYHKYYMFSPKKRKFSDIQTLIDNAVLCDKDSIDLIYKKVCQEINKTFEPYKKSLDIYSNLEANCINYVIGHKIKKVFPAYNKIKTILVKRYGDKVSSVKYKHSKITFLFYSEETQTQITNVIYVCDNGKNNKDPLDDCVFVFNGHLVENFATMEKVLNDFEASDCFTAEKWFIKGETDVVNYYFNNSKK